MPLFRSNKNKRRSSFRSNHLSFDKLEQRQLLASVPAFSGDAGLYQTYSNLGRTGEVNLDTGTFEIAEFNAGTKINAVGFRDADNFAYGVKTSTHEIVRIGVNGAVEILGSVEGLPINKGTYFVGDFANDDLLYLRNSGQQRILYGVNVDSLTIENVVETTIPLSNFFDIAFNNLDEKFYASQRGVVNRLLSVDLAGNVEIIGENGIGRLTFGAMYADADGNIFGGANQTGDVYRFDKSTGEATVVGHGPTSGTNDGFSNANLVLELAPLANDDVIEIDGLSTAVGNLFTDSGNGGDIDANDDPFTVTAVNGESSAVDSTIVLESGSTLAVASTGHFVYNPSSQYTFLELGETASDTASYTITDSTGRSSTATLTVNIDGRMSPSSFGTVNVTGLDFWGGPEIARLRDVGDINGDGHNDGAVSVPSADVGKGVTFVVFGSESGFVQDFDINQLRTSLGGDGSLGTIFFGIANNDLTGYDFSSAGDLNGDGVNDLIIGAKDADANGVQNSGRAFVVFGNQNGFGSEFELSTLTTAGGGDGSAGLVLNGIAAHDLASETVAGLGDVNGDGIDDIAIGAKHADADPTRKNSGQTFVVFGNPEGFGAELDLADLRTGNGGDGTQGLVINGVKKHDLAGSVKGGGDINADGIADILISAYNADPKGLTDAGQSYVIYGKTSGFDSEFELSSLLVENGSDGSAGFAINGNRRNEHHGSHVAIADFDDDGIADLLVGFGDFDATCSTVVYGGEDQFGAEVNLGDYDQAPVFLDNFDSSTGYDSRSWDTLPYSVTLHSSSGTRVSIWGDPHVIIEIGGVIETFDIGYGPGNIELSGGVTVNWDTFGPDDGDFPDGPPIRSFSIEATGDEFDQTVSTEDGINVVDQLTAMTEAQLLEFASVLRTYAGDRTQPLTQNG